MNGLTDPERRWLCSMPSWTDVDGRALLERFDSMAAFIDWLLAMDDPEDVLGREERRTVTLTQIIERARAAG